MLLVCYVLLYAVALCVKMRYVTLSIKRLLLTSVGFLTHVTCRLTAKNRDQLRNPTLGNRVWATFTFFTAKGRGEGRITERGEMRRGRGDG